MEISSEAALNYTGEVVSWMSNMCKDQKIQISTVSDLNRCYKKLTYEKNDIVKSMELYRNDILTYVPLSFHWNQFINPCKFVQSFNLRF